MSLQHRITTVDNPFDPFDEFESWFAFDSSNGYHSSSLLGRLSIQSEELSTELQNKEDERAIDEIILNDPISQYKKVSREVEELYVTG